MNRAAIEMLRECLLWRNFSFLLSSLNKERNIFTSDKAIQLKIFREKVFLSSENPRRVEEDGNRIYINWLCRSLNRTETKRGVGESHHLYFCFISRLNVCLIIPPVAELLTWIYWQSKLELIATDVHSASIHLRRVLLPPYFPVLAHGMALTVGNVSIKGSKYSFVHSNQSCAAKSTFNSTRII